MTNRFLSVDKLPPVISENMTEQANMGYFGFNLSGLYSYIETKELEFVSIESFQINTDNDEESLNEPIVILEVNPDFLNKDDEFMFERDLNFFVASGNKRLESMIASGKKSAVYLLRMEEILPYIVHGQENFVDYWNEKLESFCDRIR